MREESARGITLNPFSDRVIETSGFLKQGIVGQLVFLQREFINCRCDFCRKDIYSENVVLDQALLSLEMRQDRDISNLSDPSV